MASDSRYATDANDTVDAANRDPITNAPGTHMVGTGLGAAAGGVAGIATSVAAGLTTGTLLGGPLGAAVGLVAGAVVGGLAGKAIGEEVNPTREEEFWRDAYKAEPYYDSAYNYADYSPAYRTGYEGFRRNAGKSFEEMEQDLNQDYQHSHGKSRLSWEQARPAARSAWTRLFEAINLEPFEPTAVPAKPEK